VNEIVEVPEDNEEAPEDNEEVLDRSEPAPENPAVKLRDEDDVVSVFTSGHQSIYGMGAPPIVVRVLAHKNGYSLSEDDSGWAAEAKG
jgi:hypothetical protein